MNYFKIVTTWVKASSTRFGDRQRILEILVRWHKPGMLTGWNLGLKTVEGVKYSFS